MRPTGNLVGGQSFLHLGLCVRGDPQPQFIWMASLAHDGQLCKIPCPSVFGSYLACLQRFPLSFKPLGLEALLTHSCVIVQRQLAGAVHLL